MTGVLQELFMPTQQGKLRWYQEGDGLHVSLPSRLKIYLGRGADGTLTARVERLEDEVLGTIDSPAGRDSLLALLYRAATDAVRKDVYAEIIQAIKLGASSGRP